MRIVDEIQYFITPYSRHSNTSSFNDSIDIAERYDRLNFCIPLYHPLLLMGFLETFYFKVKKGDNTF